MEPEYVHVPTKNGVRSVYISPLEDGKYQLEIDGDVVQLVKRGNTVEVDVDMYYVQQGLDFWWFDGEEFYKIDVAIIDANYATAFMNPRLLMAYAEVWPFINVIVVTQNGIRKFTFGDDIRELGIRYAGHKTGIISPVVEERDSYKKVCLTCIDGFKAFQSSS